MTSSIPGKIANKLLWEAHRHGRKVAASHVLNSRGDLVVRIDQQVLIEPTWGYPSAAGTILIEEPLSPSWSSTFRPWRFAIPSREKFSESSYREVLRLPHAVLVRDLYEWNYFHFHLDTLARVRAISEAGLAELPLIVGPYVHELAFARDALRTGRWSSLDWLVHRRDQLIQVDCLYYVTLKASLADRATFLREQVDGQIGVNKGGPPLLFLTRTGNATRKLKNGADVSRLLLGKGFVEVDTGALPFVEQVRMVGAAERVVALHGAGMTNLIYADPSQLRVLELYGRTFNSFDFRTMLQSLGSPWIGLEGEPAAGDPRAADFMIDLGALEAAVDKLLA